MDSGLESRISLVPNTFTVLLPNRNGSGDGEMVSIKMTKKLLEFIGESPRARREVQNALGTSQISAIRILGSMVKRGADQERGFRKKYEICSSGDALW